MHGTDQAAARELDRAKEPGTRRTVCGEDDPRITGLCAAVSGLRREIAAYAVEFADRAVAESELAALASTAEGGSPEVARLRRSLLLVTAAVGSVSALAPALAHVRAAIELFGPAAPAAS
ncbi:DUF5955 family protein [Streptomyces sp. NPDC007088]|uniref:DUF5955 family protein n=1 Tax=Streptomyces sp. NPDC007088 TaxID=3364773 RepID=UPI0036C63073